MNTKKEKPQPIIYIRSPLLTKALHSQFKAACASRDESMTDVLIDAMKKYTAAHR
jgi:hypothetical protein